MVERHPDRLLAVAREVLEQDPERVIPLLLDQVSLGEEPRAADSAVRKATGHPDHLGHWFAVQKT